MMEDLLRFVPDVHFEQIPIKNLVSNQEYQRNISLKQVKKAAADFDICQINPVKVSRRNGINYVFNGQHTIEIIAAVSGSRETPVWCMIYDDLDYTKEADIFANQMNHVKPLLPYEIFIGNIEAGSDKHLNIKHLVESYDMKITPKPAPNGICAVSTLEHIYDKYGFHVLERVLMLCISTWEGATNSLSANIMKGIARIIDAYGSQIDDEIFKEKIGSVSVKEISRSAKERGEGSLGYAEAMVSIYNAKRRGNLLKYENLHKEKKTRAFDVQSDEDIE